MSKLTANDAYQVVDQLEREADLAAFQGCSEAAKKIRRAANRLWKKHYGNAG